MVILFYAVWAGVALQAAVSVVLAIHLINQE